MKNILVLGTSHVGALKAGFDSLASEELTDICRNTGKVNFAGFRMRLLDNFYLNSNLDLVPHTPRFFKKSCMILNMIENLNAFHWANLI